MHTLSSETCPSPCYPVQIYVADGTRSVELQGIQMDLDVLEGATPALLPIPDLFTNLDASGDNAFVEGANGNFQPFRGNLASTLGASPAPDFDALVADAADRPGSVMSLAAVFGSGSGCVADRLCALHRDALARSRIPYPRTPWSSPVPRSCCAPAQRSLRFAADGPVDPAPGRG